ncbi:oxygen-dependent coproporphyrinogen oxidase [Marinigracilibium pacificum]|uniref:coproporphyrinogen oxidase n=1 Tax=Marinigracilibium pacificum TaxID=2729599 RepID=A0A848J161_9BACT|nr:oxygen-dependent coproporphyrinogen oxidase [Marinigracilibium pacificum]NMM49255.1 oxygen-dependent coproporphyrinogen oxidase [Marinigracilibium pacificum]
MINKETITEWFKSLQDEACNILSQADGKGVFFEDAWSRPGGGGGRTRIIQNGNVIEKGAINFSAVYGETPEKILQALNLSNADFYATGVSTIQHPFNPFVPIIHMNVRYFEMSDGTWWFGGGIDLTPHYIDDNDASDFHSELKKICDSHDTSYYDRFKNWADDYFYIKHRKETRGIGGIFFDRLNDKPKEDIFEFVKDVGTMFANFYKKMMLKHQNDPFTESDINWRNLRRGRYVEFNLVWDKGTKFGLDTDGRTESILASLPPYAQWPYKYDANPKEQETLDKLKKGIDWINKKGL